MNVVSIREITPDVGKEKLAEIRFKRASDKYDQAGVDSLIQEVLTNFN